MSEFKQRRRNKKHSKYIVKKYVNKQSRWSKSGESSYGGYWTPPTSGTLGCKIWKKQKKLHIKRNISRIQNDGFIDSEIFWDDAYFKETYNEINESYYDYSSIPIWQCPLCTYNNIERLSFCSMCNMPFDFNYNNNKNIIRDCNLISFEQNRSNKNRKKRKRKSRMKRLKKYGSYTMNDEEYKTFYNKCMNKLQKPLKKPKEEQEEKYVEKQYKCKNNITITINMSLKRLSKFQYIASKVLLSSDYKNCQRNIKTFSFDVPIKLKNFELLQCIITIYDNDKNENIKSIKLVPDELTNIYFPIYLCEHESIKLCKISPHATKIDEVSKRILQKCIPNILTQNVIFKFNSIHYPIYNSLPISYDICRILLEFLPSIDIIRSVLTLYIGYHEIGLLSMNATNVSFKKQKKIQFIDEEDENLIRDECNKYKKLYYPPKPEMPAIWIAKKDYDYDDSSSCIGNLFGDDSSSDDSSTDSDCYRFKSSYFDRPSNILSFESYCFQFNNSWTMRPDRIVKIKKSPLKYVKTKSVSRYTRNKWSAYHKLNA